MGEPSGVVLASVKSTMPLLQDAGEVEVKLGVMVVGTGTKGIQKLQVEGSCTYIEKVSPGWGVGVMACEVAPGTMLPFLYH